MAWWREIADVVFRGIGSEAQWRRDHPCETAEMFRDRAKYWTGRGRRALARIATRRARRWERRCKALPAPKPGSNGTT